jgi:DNA-binding transcriptional ArsR family regulator
MLVRVTGDAFVVLAEPTRRRILSELRGAERSVGELVDSLDLPQPTVSKHLKVLREAGFVSARVAAQQRIYLERHLDALERHLDAREGSG